MRDHPYPPIRRFAGWPLLLAFAALGLAACNPGKIGQSAVPRETGAIAAKAVWPGQTTILAAAKLEKPMTVPAGVLSIQAQVSAADMSTPVSQCFNVSSNPSGGTVTGVPAGNGRNLTLTAYNQAGCSGSVMYSGTTGNVIGVPAGGTTAPVTVYMVADPTNNPGGGGWGPGLVWDDTTGNPPTTWDNAVWQ